MSAWVLVPCLVALRAEFNAVSPGRDKGADGSIGDSAHTSSSDHTPDEDSDVLRDHDPDSKNEVHALDIDSSGPWPEPGWFDRTIRDLVAREKAEFESPDIYGRLQNVIWNRRIASRSWGWTWRAYTLADPHTNHAHFSARYLTRTENDTRPWGVLEDDMTPAQFLALLNDDKVADRMRQLSGQGMHSQIIGRSDDTFGTAIAKILARSAGDDTQAIAEEVVKRLAGGGGELTQIATALRTVLGTRAAEVGRLLQQS